MRRARLYPIGLVLAFGLAGSPACQRDRAAPAEPEASATSAEATTVLLAGRFANGAKPASGEAQIVRRGDRYELVLRKVRVDSRRTVRVYLVGVERASTTRSVIETEQKYDMAELDQTTDQQIVPLPSEPAPELRSVVLWEPTYGVNLGYAALGAPGG
jgi:hypothetical protein